MALTDRAERHTRLRNSRLRFAATKGTFLRWRPSGRAASRSASRSSRGWAGANKSRADATRCASSRLRRTTHLSSSPAIVIVKSDIEISSRLIFHQLTALPKDIIYRSSSPRLVGSDFDPSFASGSRPYEKRRELSTEMLSLEVAGVSAQRLSRVFAGHLLGSPGKQCFPGFEAKFFCLFGWRPKIGGER